jgi:hypothetical protein
VHIWHVQQPEVAQRDVIAWSDHGANRLCVSALMRGLADCYFALPATITDYLGREGVRAAQRGPR